MTKFAFASLKYHKQASAFYFFLLVVSTSLLLFINSLMLSLPFLLSQTDSFLSSAGYQEEKQEILQQIEYQFEQLVSLYTQGRQLLFLLITGLLCLFFTIYQLKKQDELLAWYQSGSSRLGWIRLNLIESLLAFACVILACPLILLISQRLLSPIVVDAHLQVTDYLGGLHFHDVLAVNQGDNRFLVRFPTTNTALITAIQLTNRQWIILFFNALIQTAITLAAIVMTMNTIVCASLTFWRYHLWRRPSR